MNVKSQRKDSQVTVLNQKKLDIETYFASKEISSTDVVRIAKGVSLRTAWTLKHQGIEPTPAMLVGTAFHERALLPSDYAYDVAVREHDGRTKAGKAEVAEAELEGYKLISKSDGVKVTRMLETLNDELARHGLEIDKTSTEVIKYDKELNRKAMVDYYMPDVETIVDLKTTTDLTDDAIKRRLFYQKGVLQAVHYMSVFQVPKFMWWFISSEYPYEFRSVEVSMESLMENNPLLLREYDRIVVYINDSLDDVAEGKLERLPGHESPISLIDLIS